MTDKSKELLAACSKLESGITDAATEHGNDKRHHRHVKLLVGWAAILSAVVASATAFQDVREVTAIAALITAVCAGAQTFQNPAEKEADHQDREASCEHLARRVRHLRILISAEPEDDALQKRIQTLDEISDALRAVRAKAPPGARSSGSG